MNRGEWHFTGHRFDDVVGGVAIEPPALGNDTGRTGIAAIGLPGPQILDVPVRRVAAGLVAHVLVQRVSVIDRQPASAHTYGIVRVRELMEGFPACPQVGSTYDALLNQIVFP